MLWALILQGLAVIYLFMRQLVSVNYHFSIADAETGGDEQWDGTINAMATAKGNDIISSLLTIVHYGLNFVAQFTLLLPAVSSSTYNTYLGTVGGNVNLIP